MFHKEGQKIIFVALVIVVATFLVPYNELKDISVNKARNFAIGLGLGYSYNRFNQNLKIDASTQPKYTIVDGGSFNKNNFAQHLIEFPLEFRWRTSNSVKSDLNMKADVSVRNNKTIIRYLDLDNNQVSAVIIKRDDFCMSVHIANHND